MMSVNQAFQVVAFVVLIALQTTSASDLNDQKHLFNTTSIPDEDFGTLLTLLTQLLVTNRADIKALQSSIQLVQETVQQLKQRVDNLDNLNSQLSNAVVQTQEQVERMSSSLNLLQSAAVTNLRLGPSEGKTIWNDVGYSDVQGYIITGVHNFDADYYVDTIYRRKMQVQINGGWVDI